MLSPCFLLSFGCVLSCVCTSLQSVCADLGRQNGQTRPLSWVALRCSWRGHLGNGGPFGAWGLVCRGWSVAGAECNAQSQAWGLVGSLEGKPWAWCRSWWVATAARLCDWSGQLLDQQPSDTSHQKIPLSSLPPMMQQALPVSLFSSVGSWSGMWRRLNGTPGFSHPGQKVIRQPPTWFWLVGKFCLFRVENILFCCNYLSVLCVWMDLYFLVCL